MQNETTGSIASFNPFLAKLGCSSTFIDRFWKFVKKTESCWIWTGHIMVDGYGHIAKGPLRAGPIRAHKASWIIHNGEIPEGLCVLHDCPGGDNRACVNPAHLWLGTIGDNNRDMVRKGVHVPPCLAGENHPMAKLSWDEVLEIRRLYVPKYGSRSSLAKIFGVSGTTVMRVVRGTHWNRSH